MLDVRVPSFAALLVCLALSPVDAAAKTTSKEAAAYMQKLGDRTLAALADQNANLGEREAKVREILAENLALDKMGRFVVGGAWRKASPDLRAEYQELFNQWVTLTYARQLGGYSGEEFKIVNTKIIGKKEDALVTTQISRPSGPPLRAGWRIRQTNNGLKILDVMVENVSMLVAQRSEFKTVIKKQGFAGLVEILRAKVSPLSIKR